MTTPSSWVRQAMEKLGLQHGPAPQPPRLPIEDPYMLSMFDTHDPETCEMCQDFDEYLGNEDGLYE